MYFPDVDHHGYIKACLPFLGSCHHFVPTERGELEIKYPDVCKESFLEWRAFFPDPCAAQGCLAVLNTLLPQTALALSCLTYTPRGLFGDCCRAHGQMLQKVRQKLALSFHSISP